MTPTRFLKKAGQKLLRVTAEILIINPERSEFKSFLPTFFKKVGGVKGRQPLVGFLRAKPLNSQKFQQNLRKQIFTVTILFSTAQVEKLSA